MTDRYIIELRDKNGHLDFSEEAEQRKKAHPYLFSNYTFTIDELCYYMSYGQGRDNPSGPMDLQAFMDSIGISFRVKTW